MGYQFTLEDKIEIVKFFRLYGAKETIEAVKLRIDTLGKSKSISKSTLYQWSKEYKEIEERSLYDCSFAPKSKRPKRIRQSSIDLRIYDYILELRRKHFAIGKAKVKILLDKYCKQKCIDTVSQSTVGRVINQLKANNLIPVERSCYEVSLNGKTGNLNYTKVKAKLNKNKTRKKIRKPKGASKDRLGDLLQVDAITYHIQGVKRYLVCIVDIATRISYVEVFHKLNSNNSKITLQNFETKYKIKAKQVQTDNGFEYYKDFDKYLEDNQIIHYWNNPRSPKQNAFVERFNRSIEEEFIDLHLVSLKQPNLAVFKQELDQYLYFFNNIRPHFGLQLLTPMEQYKQLDGFSNMY